MKIMLTIVFCYLSSVVYAGETTANKESVPDRTNTQKTQQQINKSALKTEPKINTSIVLGMNVRGNKESPLSLTIVPWRSAEHNSKDPEIQASWQPVLGLLQPEAYRRNINAFLKSRQLTAIETVSGTQNENQ